MPHGLRVQGWGGSATMKTDRSGGANGSVDCSAASRACRQLGLTAVAHVVRIHSGDCSIIVKAAACAGVATP